MMPFSTFSARLRAFILLLGLLPVGLGMIGFSMFSRDRIIAEAHEDITETVAFQKRLIDDWLLEQSNNMDFLAQEGAVRRQDYDATNHLFMEFMATHPEMNAIVYVDPSGKTGVDPGSETGIDVSDREYFKAAKQGRSHISEVLIGRQSGKALVIIASPVRDMKGEFGGAVFTVLHMGTVDSWLTELKPGMGGISYLIGEDDLLLTDFDGAGEYERLETIDANRISEIIKASESGEPYTSINQGLTVVGATTLAKNGNWRIITELPLENVLSDATSYTKLFGLACLAALIIVTPMAWLLVRSMVNPLRILAFYARDVREGWESGSCPLVSKSAPKEIIDLQGAFCSMVARLEENAEAMRRIAVTDQLTGMANRRKLEEEGTRLINACIRGGTHCAALLIDIDHFKRVNDAYGHAVGDKALVHVADIIAECCRISDIASRHGGEEFVVVAPNADSAQAKVLAERIRIKIEQTPLLVEDLPLSLTVSVGVAELSSSPSYGLTHLDDMLGRADSALYTAKESGRNRVCVFNKPCND